MSNASAKKHSVSNNPNPEQNVSLSPPVRKYVLPIAAALLLTFTLSGCVKSNYSKNLDKINSEAQISEENLAKEKEVAPPLAPMTKRMIVVAILGEDYWNDDISLTESNVVVSYQDSDLTLDLYNEKDGYGVAVLDEDTMSKYKPAADGEVQLTDGRIAAAKTDDDKTVNVLLVDNHFTEDQRVEVRALFNDFVKWLTDNT